VVPFRDVTHEDVSERQPVKHQRFLGVFRVQNWNIVNWYYASSHLIGIFGQVSRRIAPDRFVLILPIHADKKQQTKFADCLPPGLRNMAQHT
jgi:hypothetical protein